VRAALKRPTAAGRRVVGAGTTRKTKPEQKEGHGKVAQVNATPLATKGPTGGKGKRRAGGERPGCPDMLSAEEAHDQWRWGGGRRKGG